MGKVKKERIKMLGGKPHLQISAWLPLEFVRDYRKFIRRLNEESTDVQKITEKATTYKAIDVLMKGGK